MTERLFRIVGVVAASVNGASRRCVGGPSKCVDFLPLGVADSVVFFHPWKVLMAPRIRTIPLPLVPPDGITGSHGNPYDVEFDAFLGGGNNHHQSTQEWTDSLAQAGEASTSLATAKPKITENNAQSEVSNFLPR
jgi:hypothetical protein